MGKSYADVLLDQGQVAAREQGREEGREEGARIEAVRSRQKLLFRLLMSRFREVPANIAATVDSTSDLQQLETWFDAAVAAKTLGEVGIG